MRRIIASFGYLSIGIAMVTFFTGCQQPQPAQCVCNCEGPPPEGAIIKIKESAEEKEAAAAPSKVEAPAAKSVAPAAPVVARGEAAAKRRAVPPARVPRKARGRIAAEPGSGIPKVMGDSDKKEMKEVFLQFSKAAKSRNLGEMKKTTTERLGNSLESSLEKYAERLYRRTDLFSAGAETGVTIGATNDLGDGNFDIEIKFGTGNPVHVLFFKEEGNWRLNRL